MNRTGILATLVAALAAGVAVAWWTTRGGEPPGLPLHATLLDTPRALPEFALADQAGRPFGRERFTGRWSIVFFGFTHCPDICPTTLATLADLKRQLADLPADDRPQVVFVSVDPGRDTPEALARYLVHFDREFVGATGDPAAIAVLTGALGVPVLVGAPADDGNYTVDHGAALFVVGPDAAWRAISSAPHVADELARDYRRIVATARP